MGNSVNRSLRTISRQEKKTRALALRREGCTFHEISKRLPCSLGEAHKLVTEGTQDIPREEADAVRAMELQRLDRMWKGLTAKGAFTGNPRAVDSALRIMVRRAKLLGLDAPEKVELGGHIETSATVLQDELLSKLARLSASVGSGASDPKPDGG